MNLPRRSAAHITETGSFKIFRNSLPNHWLIREVSERDYGIDVYVELVSSDLSVTGDLLLWQLKGTDKIVWNRKGVNASFGFTGTKQSTANYWMKLGVPVFLCLTDGADSKAYFVNAKEQIRQRYDAFKSQKTFTFEFNKRSGLNDPACLADFILQYRRERLHSRFASDTRALLVHIAEHCNFCQEHFGRDHFLELEPLEMIAFQSMYESALSVATHLNVPWNLPSLHELFAQDCRMFRQPMAVQLHEDTVSKFIKDFVPVLVKLIDSAQDYIAESHGAYWRETDLLLWNACANHDFDYAKRELQPFFNVCPHQSGR